MNGVWALLRPSSSGFRHIELTDSWVRTGLTCYVVSTAQRRGGARLVVDDVVGRRENFLIGMHQGTDCFTLAMFTEAAQSALKV